MATKKSQSSSGTQDPGASLTRAERRDAARIAAKEQREVAARRAKRNVRIGVLSAAGLVVALVVGIYFIFAANQGPEVVASTSKTALKGGMVYAKEGVDAKDVVTVTIYSDYICPFCGELERAVGPTLREYVESGTVVIDYHPVAFLDRFSNGTEFSTRATAAVFAVGELESAKFPDFHEALFANQPEENSDGLSDEVIANLAREAGVSSATIEKFGDKKYSDKAKEVSQQAVADGVKGTPAVKIEGEDYKLTNEDVSSGSEFKKAIDAAIAAKG